MECVTTWHRNKRGAEVKQFVLETPERFIILVKQSTYAGGGKGLLPYWLGSKDLQLAEGDWAYQDSYLGESDFIGQEIVYYQHEPVWGMNYLGVILQPGKITSPRAGQMIQQGLSLFSAEGRFLGRFEHQD